jgi:hypothetical protein
LIHPKLHIHLYVLDHLEDVQFGFGIDADIGDIDFHPNAGMNYLKKTTKKLLYFSQ